MGSASLISDYKGDGYQKIEYTPYGENWVEKTQNQRLEYLPYKFTAKELDEEARKYNQSLPCMGGVFNHTNGNLYH